MMASSSEVQDDSSVDVQKDAVRPPPVMLIDRVSGEVRSSREWDVIMGGHLERPLVFSKVSFPPCPEREADVLSEQEVKGFNATRDFGRLPRSRSPRIDDTTEGRQSLKGGWKLEKAAQVLNKQPQSYELASTSARSHSPLRKASALRASDFQDRPYECHVCYSRFLKKHHLQAHLLTHSDVRPFVCSMCGKSYRLRQHLTRHEQQHYGLRPHVCELCGMTFRLREHLKRHQAVRHQMWKTERDGGNPSQSTVLPVNDNNDCPAEEAGYPAKSLNAESSTNGQDLGSSSAQVGEQVPPPVSRKATQRGVYCKICTMQFESNEQLMLHEQWHESKGDVLLCPHCPREFRRIDNLYRHLVTHKERTEFVCGDCGRTFGRRDNLARHQRSACRVLHATAGQQLVNDVH